jgi:hypothetical protein
LSDRNSESGRNGSSVGSGVAEFDVDELGCAGFGAFASITQPIRKLKTLVSVIQNRIPSFKSFI